MENDMGDDQLPKEVYSRWADWLLGSDSYWSSHSSESSANQNFQSHQQSTFGRGNVHNDNLSSQFSSADTHSLPGGHFLNQSFEIKEDLEQRLPAELLQDINDSDDLPPPKSANTFVDSVAGKRGQMESYSAGLYDGDMSSVLRLRHGLPGNASQVCDSGLSFRHCASNGLSRKGRVANIPPLIPPLMPSKKMNYEQDFSPSYPSRYPNGRGRQVGRRGKSGRLPGSQYSDAPEQLPPPPPPRPTPSLMSIDTRKPTYSDIIKKSPVVPPSPGHQQSTPVVPPSPVRKDSGSLKQGKSKNENPGAKLKQVSGEPQKKGSKSAKDNKVRHGTSSFSDSIDYSTLSSEPMPISNPYNRLDVDDASPNPSPREEEQVLNNAKPMPPPSGPMGPTSYINNLRRESPSNLSTKVLPSSNTTKPLLKKKKSRTSGMNLHQRFAESSIIHYLSIYLVSFFQCILSFVLSVSLFLWQGVLSLAQWFRNQRNHRKKRRRPAWLPTGLQANVELPKSPEETICRLLACPDKDAYSILGLRRDALEPDISRYYREQASLVHQRSCPPPGCEEAFRLLHHAFQLIGSPEHRRLYDQELTVTAPEEGTSGSGAAGSGSLELCELMSRLELAVNRVPCERCRGAHLRVPTDRAAHAARYCAPCQMRHPAREGELWAESRLWGLRRVYFACMEGRVYQVNELAVCHADVCSRLPADVHRCQHKLRSLQQPQGRAGR